MIGLLKAVMGLSLAGAGVMLIIAWIMSSLDGLVAQVFLTFVAFFFGSLLTQVQLRSGRRRAMTGPSRLQFLGALVIVVSQISFLTLVWTDWKQAPMFVFVWRVWWISMVPSVFVTHLILIRSVRTPRGSRMVEYVGTVCIVWAGLMILWFGFRAQMLSDISPAYLWIGAVPAAGTVLCSILLAMRQFLRVGPPRPGSKRGLVAGVLMSHLVLALAGFYIGQAIDTEDTDPKTLVEFGPGKLFEQVAKHRYDMQARLATYFGDTRILKREPFITVEQIKVLQEHLRPGDIVLERRNWYMSNAALPGFWPHAALYVGSVGDMEKLGVLNHPVIRKHIVEICMVADSGRQRLIIEAVSEGVVLMPATHSLHADYIAVLRPRLTQEQIAKAIVRALEHKGKPYDFDFDFSDTEKIVCTQLVSEAYKGMIDFELVSVLGRDALPAGQIAKKFADGRGRHDQTLDMVLFLDAVPDEGLAKPGTEETFVESISRPRAFVEN